MSFLKILDFSRFYRFCDKLGLKGKVALEPDQIKNKWYGIVIYLEKPDM